MKYAKCVDELIAEYYFHKNEYFTLCDIFNTLMHNVPK